MSLIQQPLPTRSNFIFHDIAPSSMSMKEEILLGLSQPQKCISPKYFYDENGSRLFEEICRLKEYYPTRTENLIFEGHADEMAELIGPDAVLIEPGAGNITKARILLSHMKSPVAYVPIEISRETLLENTTRLAQDFPDLKVYPVRADYTKEYVIPPAVGHSERRVGFFPGSTIGNFDPVEASAFLKRLSRHLRSDGGLLIGVDIRKDRRTLESAYADSEGVTAQFNLNVLHRLNRELGATFIADRFKHRAIYDERKGRVEMHLVSTCDQVVRVAEEPFRFRKDETIHTENSYKYSVAEFKDLASQSGFALKKHWMDPAEQFAVYYFECERSGHLSERDRSSCAELARPAAPARHWYH